MCSRPCQSQKSSANRRSLQHSTKKGVRKKIRVTTREIRTVAPERQKTTMTNTSSSPRYPAGIRLTLRSRERARQQLARPACKQGERGRDQIACNPKLPKKHLTTALLSTFLASNRGVIIEKGDMTCLLHLLSRYCE